MQKQRFQHYGLVVALAVAIVSGMVGTAVADSSSSAHYEVNQTQFGAGASLHDCSSNYCAKTSVGDSTVGSDSSPHFRADTGFNTTEVPLLEVIVQGGTQDLGVLDSTHTGTATNYVKVRNYLSNGYVIQLTGPPPSQGMHTLTGLTTPTTSHQGAEQFGMNMVANGTPSVGADPVQVPDSSFSFGAPSSDYGTADLFKYVNGDIIAQSSKSSGETDYTMSFIINVANSTPGGRYNGSFSAVVVPTY